MHARNDSRVFLTNAAVTLRIHSVVHIPVQNQATYSLNTSMTPPEPSTSSPSDLLGFLAAERVSPQWMRFLEVLFSSLHTRLDAGDVQQMLFQAGGHFAGATPLDKCETLIEIQGQMNDKWRGLQWGYVVFTDQGESLLIEHFACPLAAVPQLEPGIAPAFLQGVYAEWLKAAGAANSLRLVHKPIAGRDMCIAFELVPL